MYIPITAYYNSLYQCIVLVIITEIPVEFQLEILPMNYIHSPIHDPVYQLIKILGLYLILVINNLILDNYKGGTVRK